MRIARCRAWSSFTTTASTTMALPFLICWIPLDVIDPEVGGLAVVEGVHQKPTLHRKEGMKIHPIRQADVPPDAWRGTTYRPGDVLLMSLGTPHSGIDELVEGSFSFVDGYASHAVERRRCRSWERSAAVSAQQVVIRDARGEHTLRFDERSFVRGLSGRSNAAERSADTLSRRVWRSSQHLKAIAS